MAFARRRKSLDVYSDYYSSGEPNEDWENNYNANDNNWSYFNGSTYDNSGDEKSIQNTSQVDTNKLGRNRIQLCGNLPYCESSSALKDCNKIPLKNCNQCSLAKGSIFLTVLVLLGLCILIGNMLIIAVGYLRHKKKKMQKLDILKVSLAFADLLTGVQLVVFLPYNFAWTTGHTIEELTNFVLNIRGTPWANSNMAFVMFSYTSSMYHLLYIGIERMYAIKKPLSYRMQSKRSVIAGLIMVWILSLTSCSVPIWFPEEIFGGFVVSVVNYVPVLTKTGSRNYTALYWVLGLFWILPFAIMTCLTIGVGILSVSQFNMKDQNVSHRVKAKKMEQKIFITVAIMQLGFTLTLVPYIVISMIYFNNGINCKNVTLPYAITFYLSMVNSLVNVIVYNAREKNFRSSILEVFTNVSTSIHWTSIRSNH